MSGGAEKFPETAEAVMTLTETARYLKVSEKTVLRMVQSGQFPGVKVSSQWRFVRAVVDDWLNVGMHARPKRNLLGVVDTVPPLIPITRLVSLQRIILDMKPGKKADVLAQLVAPLEMDGLVTDAKEYVTRLLARERMVSTAIGHGLAIPHLREQEEMKEASPFIVIGICREGTDFNSLDGRKTFVFAMPCAGSEMEHLRLLAKISLVFRNPGVLKQMTEAPTKKAVMEILAVADHNLTALGH